MKISEIAFVAYSVIDLERSRGFYEAMETPVCRMAVIADPDGNKITIHKRHPQVL